MKKRTVITTEKREVWVIRNGSVTLESTSEDVREETESLAVSDHDEPELLPETPNERNE